MNEKPQGGSVPRRVPLRSVKNRIKSRAAAAELNTGESRKKKGKHSRGFEIRTGKNNAAGGAYIGLLLQMKRSPNRWGVTKSDNGSRRLLRPEKKPGGKKKEEGGKTLVGRREKKRDLTCA